jgi:crotonobetainyl-CoA:carnitine CoA-transferase CaiB-like acyl-CoA transferase
VLEPTEGQPFSGLKVLDFAWVGVGPIVSRHLADFGATVLRVESSHRPDTLRLAPPFRDGVPGIDRSAFGAVYNTNKFGLALNLALPRARELARQLAAWADVVTDSMTPGSLAKLGLAYDDLRQINPRLVMYSTTQQGQTGPYRQFGGYGQHGAAAAGFHALTGWPDLPAAGTFGAYTDFVAPWFLYTALVAALDYRDRTGEGQYIEEAQTEAAMQLLGPALIDYFDSGTPLTRRGNDDDEYSPHDAYPSAGEDRWVVIAVRDAADFAALARAIGRPEWATDSALQTVEQRRTRRAEIDAAIGVWTAQRTAHEAMAVLQAAGVPAGAVQTCEDMFNDPQLAARGHWWQMEHGVIGRHAYDAPAWKLSETPAQPLRAGPTLGEHSEAICREILGLNDDAIAELVVEGILT